MGEYADRRRSGGAEATIELDCEDGIGDRIVAETRGNALALLELPHELLPRKLAGGFGLPVNVSLRGRIEASFLRRVQQLPAETDRLLELGA